MCGLSKGTVSKALNPHCDSRLVSDETRAKVMRAAEAIGFRPSWRARALANRKSQMIAVLNSSPSGAVPRGAYWQISDDLDDLFGERDYSMTFIHARQAYPRLERMLMDGRFDAVLGMGLIDRSVLEMVRRCRLPAVLVNSGADETWTRINVDDDGGSTQAMKHLLSLGHRRIVYHAGSRLDHPSAIDRHGAYERCMAEAGLEPLPPQIGTPQQFVQWLTAQPADRRPTAVLDFEHWTAIKLLQQLWRVKIRVPDDISVVTFNDTHPVTEVIPPLTVVALPSRQIAELATRMILERIEDHARPAETVTLPEELIIRESTAAPPSTLQ